MFIRGVKFLSKLLLLPAAIGALTYGLHYFLQFGLIEAVQLSIGVIGFLTLMWMWGRQTIHGAEINQLRKGIHDHETSIAKRINTISANMANGRDVETLERQVDYIKKNAITAAQTSKVIAADETAALQDDPLNKTVNANEDGKVISLASAKRSRQKSSKVAPIYPEPRMVADLISEGSVRIHLQPKVTLLDNSVCGFEVLARLKDDNGHLIPACQFLSDETKPHLQRKVDSQVLDQTISILRDLRRKGQKPLMHINLSIYSFSNNDSFGFLIQKLKSNKALNKTMVLEVSEAVFKTIISKHSQKMSEIMQAGFRFCIDNCQDASNAVKYMKSGMISSIKINATTFQEFDYWASIDAETNLSAQAKENGVSLIATHVEKKRQVIQLIDNNVEIAQGFLFSEPKPPASKRRAKRSTTAARKTAQR